MAGYTHVSCPIHPVSDNSRLSFLVRDHVGQSGKSKNDPAPDDSHRPKVAQNRLGDIKTEIVTKIVPLGAVELSIGPFCTEFRCERFCGNDVFRIGFGKSTIGVRESAIL